MIEPRALDWDDALIEATRRDGRSHLRVYTPSETVVVLGRGSRPEVEVNLEAVQQDEVPLLMRRGGGCSVVLDTGNVIVSTGLPLSGFGGIPRAFNTISSWVINALDNSGLRNVRQEGVSDLVLENSKIGGSCIYRTRGLLYYSTTLLFAPNLDLVERYLLHPPREPAYRAARSHREFMGSIAALVRPTDIESFAKRVQHSLSSTLGTLDGLQIIDDHKQEVLA